MIEFKTLTSFETAFIFKGFDCGDENLNKYIKTHAYQNDKNHLSKTFVCFDNNVPVGFVTLCNSQVDFEEMPASYKKKHPRYPVPAIKIARLAVEKSLQGRGYGKDIITFAFKKAIQVSLNVGVKAIIVDAKESAKNFYIKYGFIHLKDQTYFLPIETIVEALLN